MRRIKALIVGVLLLALSGDAHPQENPCMYPSICQRIPCYFNTPSIASQLTEIQIANFWWYYVVYCW